MTTNNFQIKKILDCLETTFPKLIDDLKDFSLSYQIV